uniref:Proline-rich transmembrane protein 3 isoform X2 n=1 Tax=Pogona vitticeps TaxID=103695 RepID=A0A6J0TYD0_9SAUR
MAASVELFFTWSLLLPALHLAFQLPTPDSLAGDPPLSSAPGLLPLNAPSQESPPSMPPAQLPSDPAPLEVSSIYEDPSNENWREDSPVGTAVTVRPFDFPQATSSGSGIVTSEGGFFPPLAAQGPTVANDFTLPTVGSSSVQTASEDLGPITLGLSPEQAEDRPSLTLLDSETASIGPSLMASFPAMSTAEASDIPASQEGTGPSHQETEIQNVSLATTVGPLPTVSTIPLLTLPTDRSHVTSLAMEDPTLKGDDSLGWLGSGAPEQELLGRNQTTVKYLASYRSTQVYGSPQGQEELSTSPFKPAQTAENTQNPPGTWRDSMPVASTSQATPFPVTTLPLDGKNQRLVPLPASSQSPTSKGFFPSPSTSSPARGMTGIPEVPVARERSTYWSLGGDQTQHSGTEGTHFHGSVSPGVEEAVDMVEPQRVRGAVNSKATYFGSSTPGQSTFMVRNGSGTKHPDTAGTHPASQRSTQSSTLVSTTSTSRLPTPRRGLIRVTTQRVLQHPQLDRPQPSLPAMLPASNPPCSRPGSACSQFLPNQTLLQWGDLERTLSFAWALHVYGSGVLFLLLSLLSLACLGGSLAFRVPHLPYVLGASALLLLFGILRATFFLADPYGSREWLPARAVRVLYTAPFPLLLSTFGVLLLRLFRQAHLQILPPKWQSLPVLAVLGSIQSAVLLAADLFSPPLHPAVPVGLHLLSCIAGVCLLPSTVYVYQQLRHNVAVEGTPEPGVWSGVWVLLASSGLALPCCGLQFYGVLWLAGLFGQVDLFTWGWWFVQFWFRIGELVLSFALVFLAWQALCQRYGSTDHSCWAKLMRYFSTYRKGDVPEYPNNCYDWTGAILEKVPNNDISKNLIRNPPGSGRVWALKDSNELRAAGGQGSSPSLVHPVYSPKCPNAAAAAMGRSYTSICFERESILSLAELEFRPPSPINLSRSIDEALFREHLVRDSIFLRSSLHFPSRLARQDSCSSLRGDCSTLSHTAQPLLTRPRRSSDPDCLYSLARASSMGELTTQSRGLASEPPTDTSFDSFSHTSFSRASLKISWNPWRHGLSSPESLPPEELPSQARLLPEELPPAPSSSAPNSEGEARKSFLALSKQVDSRSLSSDTIEL